MPDSLVNPRARKEAIQSALAWLKARVKTSGPLAASATINLALFALLFLYGIPRIVVDTSEAIQVTVTSFFVNTPAPEKPAEGGGGAGGESISEALASFNVTSAAPTATVAAITSNNPQALDIKIPQATVTAPKIDNALLAKTVAAAARTQNNVASGNQASSGLGNGQGKGAGLGAGNGQGGGNSNKIGKLKLQTEKFGVIVDVSDSMARNSRKVKAQAETICKKTNGKMIELKNCQINQNFVAAVNELAAEGVDTIYWICDLFDDQQPKETAQVHQILLEHKIKLIVATWGDSPSSALRAIIQETGGALDPQGPAAQDQAASAL